MALIKQSASGTNFSSLLAPFTTVDNGGARPLKAISIGELTTLRNGDMVYVESLKDYWKWVTIGPGSTAADDSTGASAQLRYCNPTVNGANPGRFERLFICSPDWLIQNFTIDNVAGNNEADGITTPLNNDNELLQRWKHDCRITAPIVVTYVQAPTTITNFSVIVQEGGSLTLLGTPVVNQAAVTITAVTALNRVTPVGWGITGATFGAGDLGKIAIITTSTAPGNVGAYAYVVAQAGTTLTVSPFGTFVVSDAAPYTLITPLVNDVVRIVTPTQLKVGVISIKSNLFNGSLVAPIRNCAVFDSLLLDGNLSTSNGVLREENVATFYARCIHSNINMQGSNGSLSLHILCGGGATNAFIVRASGTVRCRQTGFRTAAISVDKGAQLVMLVDTYLENTTLTVVAGSIVNSQGVGFFNRSSADANIVINVGGVMFQSGAVADWGTGNSGHGIKIQSEGVYSYVTKPTINAALGAGREALIGGTDKLLGAVPYIEGANGAALVLTA